MRRALALVALAACGGSRPAAVGARGWYYADNSGLDVATIAVDSAQPVSERVTIDGGVLLDRVRLRRTQLDPSTLPSEGEGHHHGDHAPDVVTSASAIAGDGAVADENRWEARLGGTYRGDGERPWSAWARGRASTEPDYLAGSVSVGGAIELARRNTVLGAELGAGRDRIEPVEAPPGQLGAWPAHHQRVTAALTASQVASSRVLLSAGIAWTHQEGRLTSPYRRALVRTTLFPEALPDDRDRGSVFVGAAIATSERTALHARLGGYRDSWGVAALTPEIALSAELADDVLATGSYRHYQQRRADFHRAAYDAMAPILSGDPRLGRVIGHTGGAHVRWTVRGTRGDRGAVSVEAGYQLIVLDLPMTTRDLVIGHQGLVAATGDY